MTESKNNPVDPYYLKKMADETIPQNDCCFIFNGNLCQRTGRECVGQSCMNYETKYSGLLTEGD